MVKKVCLIIVCSMIFLTSVCMAAEQPLGKFTREEAIQKLFTGRTLDPIEGVWYSTFKRPISQGLKREVIIVKTSLLDIKNPDDRKYDYTMIELDSPIKYEVSERLTKSEYPHIFYPQQFHLTGKRFIFINAMTLALQDYGADIFTRIYPLVTIPLQ